MMRYFVIASLISLSAASAAADIANDFKSCKAEPDSLKRLTCFDAIRLEDAASGAGPAGTAHQVAEKKAEAPIKLVTGALRLQEKDLSKRIYSPRVTLAPTFKNDTKKTVVAIEHTLVITDAFGDKVVNGLSKLDIKIPPGKSVQSDQFYFWEDNQFIQNEPYDRLAGPVGTGTAKASMIVTKAVFSDGSTESYVEGEAVGAK